MFNFFKNHLIKKESKTKTAEDRDKITKIFLNLNLLLCFILVAVLLLLFFKILSTKNELFVQVVAFLATLPVFISALQALKNKKISIDLLASIALVVSLIEKEWVSAIFINLMIASARAFSIYVKIRSHSAIDSLMKLKPKKIKIEQNGKIVEIPLKDVQKGDRIVIELGEMVPVDGRILKGEATIDQSSLTGESVPVFKKEGDDILSFTTIVSGHLTICAEKVDKETTFEKIIALVEQAQTNKSPIYSFINKFSKWYIIFTLGGALIIYLISKDATLVMGLLLVSCADDIAVATPMALMSAITHSAKHGAIIKGGDYLEGLAKLKMIVFDKTGTLTQGKLKIEKIFPFGSKNEEEILALAAIPSSCSSHPIAHAIIDYAKEKNISIADPQDFEEYGGKGMSVLYNGRKILIGKLSFFQDLKVEINQQQLFEINKEILNRFNVTLIAYDGKLVGLIDLFDEIRPNIKQTINEFKKLGIERIIMLTGDNERVAQKVAEEAGITEFHANLLPADKLEYLKKFLNKKNKVAMIGDGVNDAPGLALSDVGIAMGAIGSDVSIEAADIALMRDDISQVPELIKIGRSTMSVIRQNIVFWVILNILGFFLVFTHVLNPSGAAAYNFICDFIPIFNSLRLFK
ncbi:MAG: cation-translocating P-type ATPase [Candidatus Pacebacteria bacterium]|nr:cation-translocating P-type ATPase [Candidatus Paceibacterota bacterium]